MPLALSKWNGLPVIVQRVFDLNRSLADVKNLVTAIDDLAFAADKDVLAFGKKDSRRLTESAGKTIELEIDRRRWLRRWRSRRRLRWCHNRSPYIRHFHRSVFKNVAP